MKVTVISFQINGSVLYSLKHHIFLLTFRRYRKEKSPKYALMKSKKYTNQKDFIMSFFAD